MRYRITALVALAAVAVVAVFAGCSDNTVTVQPRDTGLAEVHDIGPGDAEFTITIPTGGTPQQPIGGPFIIRGTGIHYDEGIGALMMDLTVTNASNQDYPLPVRLEFVMLAPAGVTVLNSDNGETGEGAQIEFDFTDRDLSWTPGETSVPRSVQFGVDEGVSIGFGAHILVGPDETLGTISGVVWDDADQSGSREPNEIGIADRSVLLTTADSLDLCMPPVIDCPIIDMTRTDATGAYSFDGLGPGFYTVVIVRDRCSTHTTPTALQVILVEENGGVSDFPYADFGVVPIRNCGCDVQNGDFSAGLTNWGDENSGPGLGSGVTEVVDIDGRTDVLHMDSRAGGNYYLFRTQMTGSCGARGYGLSWDWKLDPVERSYGLAAVIIEFYDGADAVIGRYFVRRHTGDFAAYDCDRLIAENLQNHPNLFIGCEQETGTSFDWTTTGIAFDQAFFDGLSGADPGPIAAIKVILESYNNAGAGVNAYFDNISYQPLIPVGD